MRTMQTKVLESICEEARRCNLDTVVNSNYSNTGVIYFQRNGWDTVLTCSYDFQTTYATLQFTSIQPPTNKNVLIDSKKLSIKFEDMSFVMEKVMGTIKSYRQPR